MRIVLTGSSSGIGRAIALRLLQRGHTVCGLARSDQAQFAAEFPGRFLAVRCDVSSWTEVTAAHVAITEKEPGIDALITCAGVQGAIGRAMTVDPLAWSTTVRTNLDGTFFPIRAFWPSLLGAERRAKVICFSGGGATQARPHFSAYGAAKTAIVRLVETIAAEETATALDINAVAPGAIRTRMTEEVIALGPEVAGVEEFKNAVKQPAGDAAPLHRALDLVEWLLSPASDGISGRLLSAPWDPWHGLAEHRAALAAGDIFTLRRITPQDRGQDWA